MFAGHTKGPGPNMFSCFSTVKQNKNKNKIKKTNFYLLTKGAPFLEGGGGQGAIAPRHPGPVRPCIGTILILHLVHPHRKSSFRVQVQPILTRCTIAQKISCLLLTDMLYKLI